MSRPSLSTLAAAAAVVVLGACVSPGTPTTLSHPRAGHATSERSTDILAASEIATVSATTAYDAVAQLRPEFLRRRGVARIDDQTAALPIVYLDGVRQGSIDALHTIPVQIVKQIRFLSPVEAQSAFGPGHYGPGAIVIVTR